MPRTIWKHALLPSGSTIISMTKNAKILCVQTQRSVPYIWIEHDPSEEPTYRTFNYYGTGNEIPDNPGTYIGTFQLMGGDLVFPLTGGDLVFHLYEDLKDV